MCCKNSRVWIEEKIFTFKQHCTKSYITCFIIISIVFFFISIRGWHSDFKFLLTVTGISEWSGIRGSHFWTLKNTESNILKKTIAKTSDYNPKIQFRVTNSLLRYCGPPKNDNLASYVFERCGTDFKPHPPPSLT